MTDPQEATSVELDRHGADLVEQLAQARAALRGWTEIERKAKDQIAALVGDAKYGNILGQRRVTVSRNTPRRFDTNKFANEHPRLYQEYLAPGTPVTRVLLTEG